MNREILDMLFDYIDKKIEYDITEYDGEFNSKNAKEETKKAKQKLYDLY